MKKIIAAFSSCVCLFALSSCKPDVTVNVPETTAAPNHFEIFTLPPTTAEMTTEETTAEETTQNEYQVHEYVTEPATAPSGIMIRNAYFSLMLPKEWDGRYLSDTSFADNGVMTVNFRELKSAEEGYGGIVFSVAVVPFGVAPNGYGARLLHTVYTASGYYSLYAVYPSDIQYSSGAKEDHQKMTAAAEMILSTLAPGPGCSFGE